MKVLVTGGAGYIGSVCVEELCNAGHEVTVYDNLSEGHRSAIDPRATFVLAEKEDQDAINGVFKDSQAEAVIHFAANIMVGESMTNPSKYFNNNVGFALKVIDATVAAKIERFVFSSTAAIFGIPETMPMTEDLPQSPINPYGESKLMVEKLLKWYSEIHGLKAFAFRYFNAAGASDKFGEDHNIETHLIPNVLKVALGQNENCQIFGTDYDTPDGTCIRDYIHVIDLAAAHILALSSEKSGFYNLGNGNGYSVREVISACEKATGKQIAVIEKPRRAGDSPRLVASSEKAKSELGWKPKYPGIDEIVKTAWDWHSRNPEGYED